MRFYSVTVEDLIPELVEEMIAWLYGQLAFEMWCQKEGRP